MIEHTLPRAKSPLSKVLIVEGGGMKGSFSGGVLSVMAKHFPVWNYELVVAVSSGSCSATYYATALRETDEHIKNILEIWRNELDGRKLINRLKFFLGKPMLDQNYLIDYLMKEKYPFPLKNLSLPKLPPFHVVVSNIKKLKPEYIRATENNIFSLLRAATSLPIATRGRHNMDDGLYTDGAVLDPLPIRATLEAGYKDITVILNNPLPQETKTYHPILSRISFPFYGKLANILTRENYYKYTQAKELIVHPPSGVKIQSISPSFPVIGLVNTKKGNLYRAINHGIEKGMHAFHKTKREMKDIFSVLSL
ncbi:MAG: patatin-like phospholipase family protein [Leptospira sp.]|nr:patatin-like phospholipase family protein [Leptospira sp.]